MKHSTPSGKSVMPAVIVCVSLSGFYIWGSFVLFLALWFPNADPKTFSILDMFVVAAIGLTTGGVGYWLGKNHADQDKDSMLYHSVPAGAPLEQDVKP